MERVQQSAVPQPTDSGFSLSSFDHLLKVKTVIIFVRCDGRSKFSLINLLFSPLLINEAKK
jgi:hypothetical protein